MQVIKSSGETEKFNSKKIYYSVLEAKGSKKLAKEAMQEVKKRFRENFSSQEILTFLMKFLKKEPGVSERYDLKRAIMSLGPKGFFFEKYFAQILNNYEYKTQIGQKLKGKNILQEVDVTAIKEKKILIECKYHNQRGTITRLHPAMYTYARFLDLQKHNFDEPWLVSNTRASDDAINYGKGVGLKVISWDYPKEFSLRKLIEDKKLYPITIVKEINDKTKEMLYEQNITLAKDLLPLSIEDLKKKTLVNDKEAQDILNEVKAILN